MRSYEFDRLRQRMYHKHITMTDVAKAIGINPITMSNKMNGVTPFTLDEAYKISQVLEIEPKDFTKFFINRKANTGVRFA